MVYTFSTNYERIKTKSQTSILLKKKWTITLIFNILIKLVFFLRNKIFLNINSWVNYENIKNQPFFLNHSNQINQSKLTTFITSVIQPIYSWGPLYDVVIKLAFWRHWLNSIPVFHSGVTCRNGGNSFLACLPKTINSCTHLLGELSAPLKLMHLLTPHFSR